MSKQSPTHPSAPPRARQPASGGATSKSERAARTAGGHQLSAAEKARLAAEASRDEDA